MPATIKTFIAKIISQILFGAGFWINGVSESLDLHFSSCAEVPSCVAGTALRVCTVFIGVQDLDCWLESETEGSFSVPNAWGRGAFAPYEG